MGRRRHPFSETAVFIIVKANRQNPSLSHEADKVKGRSHAEKAIERLERNVSEEERAAGWYYYLK